MPISSDVQSRIIRWLKRSDIWAFGCVVYEMITGRRAFDGADVSYLRISPDGTRVVLDIRDQDNDLWMWDITRETLTRLTSETTFDRWPVWMPDGRRILFSSDRAGISGLFWQTADGSGTAERLTEGRSQQFVTATSPDGTRAVVHDQDHQDLMIVTLDKERRMQPLVQTRFAERNGEISPDGQWLAYDANDTGQYEIYVRPFPDVNTGHWQVSTTGGTRPLWSRTGQELFFLSPTGALMAARVDGQGRWSAGPPMKLFEGAYLAGAINYGRTYDVTGDGQRFLMIKEPQGHRRRHRSPQPRRRDELERGAEAPRAGELTAPSWKHGTTATPAER